MIEENQLWRCARRGCGWTGKESDKAERKDAAWTTTICPRCKFDSFYRAKRPEKPKTNLSAQEKVVSALWEFAAENKPEGASTRVSDGTKCSLKAVGNALDRIMAAFGYATINVE